MYQLDFFPGFSKYLIILIFHTVIVHAFIDQISNVISDQQSESFNDMDKEKLTLSSILFTSSSKRIITNTLNVAHSVYAVDIDGDGDMDVLSASQNDKTVAWYENDGQKVNPTFTTHVITNTANGACSLYAADIDRDGNIDILSASQYDNKIEWYKNNGQKVNPTFTTHVITNTANGAYSVYAADIDRDGHIDILSASHTANTISWYENSGQPNNPTFIKHDLTNAASGATHVHAADIDGDGDMDVLSASEADDTIAWYENNGQLVNPTFTKRNIDTSADGAYCVYAADIDGDGDIDVLSVGHYHNIVAWYENNGQLNPNFIKRFISNTCNAPHYVYAADIDGDGDMDVLSACMASHTVEWYENGGQSSNPTFTKHVITNNATNPSEVYAADIDGDGDIDVLSSGSNTVAWYQNYRLSFINCPTGKYYGVINGLSACISCAVGSYQNETGRSSCKSCPRGSYQNQTDQISCSGCSAGAYQDQIGQTVCLSCPTGRYNTLLGQKSLSACKFNSSRIYKDFLHFGL